MKVLEDLYHRPLELLAASRSGEVPVLDHADFFQKERIKQLEAEVIGVRSAFKATSGSLSLLIPTSV